MFNSRSEDAEGKEKSILGKTPNIEQLKSKEINGKPNIKNNWLIYIKYLLNVSFAYVI